MIAVRALRVAMAAGLAFFSGAPEGMAPAPTLEPRADSVDQGSCSDPVAARLWALYAGIDYCDYGATESACAEFRVQYKVALNALFGATSRCAVSPLGQWRVTFSDLKGSNDHWAAWTFSFTPEGGVPQTVGANGVEVVGLSWTWLAEGRPYANFIFPSMTGPTIAAVDLDGDGQENEVVISATRFGFMIEADPESSERLFERKVQLGRAWTVVGGRAVRMPGLEDVLITGVRDVDGDGQLEVLTYGPLLTNVPIDEDDNRYLTHVAHGPAYALFRGPDGRYSAHDPRQRAVIESACQAERRKPGNMSDQRTVIFGTVCDRALRGLPSWAPRKAFQGYSAFARGALDAATLQRAERDPLPFSFVRRDASPHARPGRSRDQKRR